MNVIEINNLKFGYKNDKFIFNDFSIKIEKGEIVAFLGENGAGKTTLFKLICNLLKAKSGKIFTKETPTLALSAKQLYDNLTCYENLDFFSRIYKNNINSDDIENILSSVNLINKKDELIKNLSTGMKQRLNIAKTIATDKKIVVLDEPSSGLDPVNQIEISTLIKNISTDKTILLSSHNMDEVAQVASRVIFIKNGEILLDEKMDELNKILSKNVHIISFKNNTTRNFEEKSFCLSDNMYLMLNDEFYNSDDVEQVIIRPLTLKDIYILLESNQYDKFINLF